VSSDSSFCHIDANGCAIGTAGSHGNNETCTVQVNETGTLTATQFDTDSGYAGVTIGGTRYEGLRGPRRVAVAAGSTFTGWSSNRGRGVTGSPFFSDHQNTTGSSWTICLAPGTNHCPNTQPSVAASYCSGGWPTPTRDSLSPCVASPSCTRPRSCMVTHYAGTCHGFHLLCDIILWYVRF